MFDFSGAMHRLINDIAHHSPEFAHLQPQSILIGLSQARTSRRYGLYAKIVPMRFEDGCRYWTKGRRSYEIEPIWKENREILYLIYFVLPRFQNLNFEEKMTTVFHELFHISQRFNGDIRRFPGSRYAHSCRKENFDQQARQMAKNYLGRTPNLDLSGFLQIKFKELKKQHGEVVGNRLPLPKLKTVTEPVAIEENGQLVLVY